MLNFISFLLQSFSKLFILSSYSRFIDWISKLCAFVKALISDLNLLMSISNFSCVLFFAKNSQIANTANSNAVDGITYKNSQPFL